jgi:hypothetical protein
MKFPEAKRDAAVAKTRLGKLASVEVLPFPQDHIIPIWLTNVRMLLNRFWYSQRAELLPDRMQLLTLGLGCKKVSYW